MTQNRLFQSFVLTLTSPFFALPFFYLGALTIAFIHPPGIHDPLRLELGPTLYNLRWSAGAAVMTALLNLNSLLEKFYLPLPLLFAGNYALTYAFTNFSQQLIRALILLLCSGFYFFIVSSGGLWLGLWNETAWT